MSAAESFQVHWSPRAQAVLRELMPTARGLGLAKELARLVKSLDHRLRRDPTSVGEVYRTRRDIEEFKGGEGFIAIDFAIDRKQRFVLVRDGYILSGQGL